MSRRWILALALSLMGSVFAQDKEKPMVNYSDSCDIKINPNAGPRIASSWNVFLSGDFIYWTARQDGLFYAISGAASGATGGRVHDVDFEWDPGFKVALGVNLPHDGWDTVAQYTWLHSDVSDSTSQLAATSNLIPYWLVGGATGTLTSAKANWDIHYNNLTWDLGRNAYLSQYMKLRLFAGLHAAWIDQDYKVDYTQTTGEINRLRLDQDFWGVGLRAGLNDAFQFTKNFSFFADLAVSILWGQFDLDRKERVTVNNVTTTVLNTGVKPHTAEPVLDVAAGFRYDGWFSQDRFHFLLQAGWEHQLWILHNEFIKNISEPDHNGNLYFQGVTVKFRLDF